MYFHGLWRWLKHFVFWLWGKVCGEWRALALTYVTWGLGRTCQVKAVRKDEQRLSPLLDDVLRLSKEPLQASLGRRSWDRPRGGLVGMLWAAGLTQRTCFLVGSTGLCWVQQFSFSSSFIFFFKTICIWILIFSNVLFVCVSCKPPWIFLLIQGLKSTNYIACYFSRCLNSKKFGWDGKRRVWGIFL